MSNQLTQQQIYEVQKLVEETRRQDAQRAHDNLDSFIEKSNEAAVKNADSALRAALVINGGAIAAVLAFIGGLASKDLIKLNQVTDVANSLTIFGYGVACAVAGMALSYFTNYMFAAVAHSKVKTWDHPYVTPGTKTKRLDGWSNVFHAAAIIAGVASLGFFIWGMVAIKNSITSFTAPPAKSAPASKPQTPQTKPATSPLKPATDQTKKPTP